MSLRDEIREAQERAFQVAEVTRQQGWTVLAGDVAEVGAEEQAPALFDFRLLARLLGFPAFPITPTILPFPLPARYQIHFGAPMRFTGSPDDEDAELERKVAEVQAAVSARIERGLAERKSVYL